jgi:hypothetical protein
MSYIIASPKPTSPLLRRRLVELYWYRSALIPDAVFDGAAQPDRSRGCDWVACCYRNVRRTGTGSHYGRRRRWPVPCHLTRPSLTAHPHRRGDGCRTACQGQALGRSSDGSWIACHDDPPNGRRSAKVDDRSCDPTSGARLSRLADGPHVVRRRWAPERSG